MIEGENVQKEDLIHMLQDEIIALQMMDDNTDVSEYDYHLQGDGSVSRCM